VADSRLLALVLALASLASLASCAANGDDEGDDGCTGRAGPYSVAVGPGTGTCDPAEIGPPVELLSGTLADGVTCGRQVIAAVASDGECAMLAELEGTVHELGIDDAVIRLESDCTADRRPCQHSYSATVSTAATAR